MKLPSHLIKVLRKSLAKRNILDESMQMSIIFEFLRKSNITEESFEDIAYILKELNEFLEERDRAFFSELCKRNEMLWKEFIHRFSGIFHGKMLKIGIFREEERWEIIQEFLLFILKKCEKNPNIFKGKSSIQTFVSVMFKNFLINYLKKHRKHKELSLEKLIEDVGFDPSYEPDMDDPCGKLDRMFDKANLKSIERLVLKLIFCDEYTQTEIAKILQVSAPYITKIKQTALMKLRKIYLL